MEEGVQFLVENRNSGSRLFHNVTVKEGSPEQMYAQATTMMRHSDIFLPVLRRFQQGYIMPTAETDLRTEDVYQALTILSRLWNRRPSYLPALSPEQYHQYIMSLVAPDELKDMADRWLYGAHMNLQAPAYNLHGDATLENIVRFKGRVFWIDPSSRPVPADIAVDAAKVLQSRLGYAGEVQPAVGYAVDGWLHRLAIPEPRLIYYYITHIIRLWRLQKDRQDWAMESLKRIGAFKP